MRFVWRRHDNHGSRDADDDVNHVGDNNHDFAATHDDHHSGTRHDHDDGSSGHDDDIRG